MNGQNWNRKVSSSKTKNQNLNKSIDDNFFGNTKKDLYKSLENGSTNNTNMDSNQIKESIEEKESITEDNDLNNQIDFSPNNKLRIADTPDYLN